MPETRVQSLGWEDPPEKGTATHASVLAWRIPWTEEPGGLESTGSKESDTTERLSLSERLRQNRGPARVGRGGSGTAGGCGHLPGAGAQGSGQDAWSAEDAGAGAVGEGRAGLQVSPVLTCAPGSGWWHLSSG